MKLRFLGLAAASLILLTASGAASFADNTALESLKQSYKRPTFIPFPDSAPYSPQLATLGKMLFFDPRLSGAQNLSCASCHSPSFGYEVPIPGAIGSANTPLGRKAPTILNAAFTPIFFWDGRARDLEEQAQGPLTAAAEMNGKFPEIVARLKQVPEYHDWFDRLFPGVGVTKENLLTAIATYERTVVTGWSPFDRWVDGDEAAISASAKRGFELFNGKAGCSACHSGWNFTDNKFHDVGFSDDDIGRGKLEPNNPQAQHAFKTPGLRNLIYRAPFGHFGQMADLESIIAFYESGGESRPSKSPLMKGFVLEVSEMEDLLNFLKCLTAEKTETALPNLPN
jgi:cytochrome c peroxidase